MPTAQPILQAKPTPTPRVTMAPRAILTPSAPARVVYGISTRRKVFALTFDDGPDPTWTPQVLAILKKWHVPATFFMVGKMVRAHPQFALKVQAAKHPIGNHSWSHPLAPRSPQSEIERTDAILHKVLHLKTTLFRPPYGVLDNGLAKMALARGENVIIWNALGADWDKHTSSDSIATKVLKGARPGGISLLHDGGGNRAKTVAALPRIIQGLRRRGFRFVTVPELLEIGSPLPISHLASKMTPRASHSKPVRKTPIVRASVRARVRAKALLPKVLPRVRATNPR